MVSRADADRESEPARRPTVAFVQRGLTAKEIAHLGETASAVGVRSCELNARDVRWSIPDQRANSCPDSCRALTAERECDLADW